MAQKSNIEVNLFLYFAQLFGFFWYPLADFTRVYFIQFKTHSIILTSFQSAEHLL